MMRVNRKNWMHQNPGQKPNKESDPYYPKNVKKEEERKKTWEQGKKNPGVGGPE